MDLISGKKTGFECCLINQWFFMQMENIAESNAGRIQMSGEETVAVA